MSSTSAEKYSYTSRHAALFALNIVGGAALIASMLYIVASAISRTVFNYPLTGALEVITYWSMPIIVFAGFAFAQITREQIDVPLIFDRLSTRLKRELTIISLIVVALTSAAFSFYTATDAFIGLELQRTGGAIGLTIWPAAFAAPLAFAGMAVAAVLDLYSVTFGRNATNGELPRLEDQGKD